MTGTRRGLFAAAPPSLRDRLLAAFFVALAFSISFSQALLVALLLVVPWTHARRSGWPPHPCATTR